MTRAKGLKATDRLAWLASVAADPRLQAGCVRIACVLANRQNHETGRLNPSVATIAREAALSSRGVRHALRQLEACGYITRRSSAGGLQGATTDYLLSAVPSAEPLNHDARVNHSSGVNESAGDPGTTVPPTPEPQFRGPLNHSSAKPGREPGKEPGREPGRDMSSTARRVLDHLNRQAGRQYQPVAVNVDLIIARIKEGFTEAQLCQVIERKVQEWASDEKMCAYLRPATLFNRTKFAQYVGELGAPLPANVRGFPSKRKAQGPGDHTMVDYDEVGDANR